MTRGKGSATSDQRPRVGILSRRIHGWSWQAFPIGMGTGAVYTILSGFEHRSPVLVGVETGFYFLNMFLFILNSSTLLLQAILYPRQALRLLHDPVKSIFVPLIVLSFATIIIGTVHYGFAYGHVSAEIIYSLYWIYIVFAIMTSLPMLLIWFNKPHDLTQFTPAYAFLVFPLMLVGVVAFNVLSAMDPRDPRSVGVLLVGYFFQGLGFFMTFFYLCIYIIRIMMTGFLKGHQANGAFVACGPPGFTALALMNLGNRARKILPEHGLVSPLAGEIWYSTSILAGILLCGLAVFFFFLGALPYWFKVHKSLDEILGCWALTFPNVGWIASIRVIGKTFEIQGLLTVHLVMAVLICVTWVVLFALTLLAFCKGRIFISDEADVLKDAGDSHNMAVGGFLGFGGRRRHLQHGGEIESESEKEKEKDNGCGEGVDGHGHHNRHLSHLSHQHRNRRHSIAHTVHSHVYKSSSCLLGYDHRGDAEKIKQSGDSMIELSGSGVTSRSNSSDGHTTIAEKRISVGALANLLPSYPGLSVALPQPPPKVHVSDKDSSV